MLERKKKKVKEKSKKRTINIYKPLSIILALALAVTMGFLIYNWYVADQADKQYEELADQVNRRNGADSGSRVYYMNPSEETEGTETVETETTEAVEAEASEEGIQIEIPEKNMDWDAIHQVNEDIYAWICIPGTEIDYPILQHPTDDSYYLTYNMNGTKGYPGCIYTELVNSRDFTDFETVVYGHNMRDASMFATLHYYESQAFFNNSPYVFIYVGDEVLVYEVFAAYTGDDRHIMYANDFSTESGRAAYLSDVINSAGEDGRLRELSLGTDSHILTLSTCIKGQSDKRYLVQAMLLNEEALESVGREGNESGKD
ncbi:MAG: class B sortase [Roseburia sp.]|nr:class B sortase [Roseburia sp.]